MTPADRLKEIEWNLKLLNEAHRGIALDQLTVENIIWLINRCKKLTNALEFYANKHMAKGLWDNHLARKALEGDE